MHIEPGTVSAAKVALANAAAISTLGFYGLQLLRQRAQLPVTLLRTGLAAVFFSVFMESFHMPVGPSELHFVGAMAMYLTLGFLPTLFGFAIGLLLQGFLFEPADLIHLAVNSLSLILPLAAVHAYRARQTVTSLDWQAIVKLDAMYYTGVTAMVGFWLSIGEEATPLLDWARFASSYLAVVAVEPLVTLGAVALLKRYQDSKLLTACFVDVRGSSAA